MIKNQSLTWGFQKVFRKFSEFHTKYLFINNLYSCSFVASTDNKPELAILTFEQHRFGNLTHLATNFGSRHFRGRSASCCKLEDFEIVLVEN